MAAGFILLLLSAQFLQFKLIWRPVEPEASDAGYALTEIDMPEDLRRFFASGADAKVRIAA